MIYTQSSAQLSECGRYRLILRRTWNAPLLRMCAVLLNPSTADGTLDDATVRVLVGRAQRMHFGGLDLVNLFSLRATDPREMLVHPYPISPPTYPALNDEVLCEAVSQAGFVLAAWGNHGAHMGRAAAVLSAMRGCGVQVHALRLTQAGHPAHPLRISYDTAPYPI